MTIKINVQGEIEGTGTITLSTVVEKRLKVFRLRMGLEAEKAVIAKAMNIVGGLLYCLSQAIGHQEGGLKALDNIERLVETMKVDTKKLVSTSYNPDEAAQWVLDNKKKK